MYSVIGDIISYTEKNFNSPAAEGILEDSNMHMKKYKNKKNEVTNVKRS